MPPQVTPRKVDRWEGIYSGLVGLFFALTVIKWGNPVIMDARISAPSGYMETVLAPWPMSWAYRFALVVLLGAFFFARNVCGIPKWWLFVPVFWFCWQIISAFFAVDSTFCWIVIPHFGVAASMFFVGVYSFSRITRLGPFWMAWIGGFVVLLLLGLRQHFGGLEETRRFLYSLPNWQELPPEFLQRISSNRIYSTLVYPNAFAGALLLLTPIVLAFLAGALGGRSVEFRWIVLSLTVGLSSGCLYWSGSKAGWLIAMIQIGALLLGSRTSGRLKVCALAALLTLSFAGFGLKYRDYFERGATSVAARMDYWRSALITIKEFPIFGSGPGSFMVRYKTLKNQESEMTRLAHNDYLQQASDSGVAGGLAFLVFWTVGVFMLYRNSCGDWLAYSVFVGVFGVALQGFVEFGCYIPGISWPSWFLLGWFVARGNPVDKSGLRS